VNWSVISHYGRHCVGPNRVVQIYFSES
jgi:hypothetical protein